VSTDTLVLDVERLTYGPDALARCGGQVVFLPYAAPGDRVAAAVVARRRGHLRARVQTVLVPGPARVAPACPAFGTCGGCQWQHLSPEAQRDAKRAVVSEQLRRVAGLRDPAVPPVRPAPAPWAYRSRITLAAEGRRLGYHRLRSHALVEIDACPIAEPVLAAHLGVARAFAAALRAPLARVTIAAAPGGVVLVARTTARPGPTDRAATERLLAAQPTVRGAVVTGGNVRLVVGDPTVRVTLEPGLDIEVPADVFTQVNPAANQLLVATVVGFVGAAPRVLDLYCGAGNFALPLARRGARVRGIERDPVAVAAARANAARLGLAGATFVAADVAAALAAEPSGGTDVVVLDPPRAGAALVLSALAALGAPRLVYVSCDPATLARDIRTLAAHGYRLERLELLDLFPQTYHVETVAELQLT
jgi:23S rRNA (uracil1939-C5)-methyltransferase